MNEKKLVHNFKSYLGLEDNTFKINDEQTAPIEELKPNLLPGELLIGAAHRVLMYTAVSEQQNGRLGSLFVTNYKLSFVMSDDQTMGGCRQKNRLLGPYDIPLSLVNNVVELNEADECGPGSRSRRRSLGPDQSLPNRVKGLQVVCKNMRVLSFGFKCSDRGQGRMIATALLHHAFPRRNHLLFAFDYNEPYVPSEDIKDVNMFNKATDWQKEMDRTNCQNWRISRANRVEDAFFDGAGDALVVPSTVLDYQLAEAARHFRKGRVPIWVWNSPEGAALARSGELYSSGSGSNSNNIGAGHAPESTLLEAARGAHPTKKPPRIISIPSRPLQTSFNKLIALCTPTTLRTFWEQDNKFYSGLENTRWLKYVSESLTLAAEAAMSLSENVTVVLQEGDGIDYCPIISSLTQLLLDSHFRTVKGFESLIQKEWVSLGHPFCDRLGHVMLSDQETSDGRRSTSPMFLIFLDCCWQLIQQFPAGFQFTEVYLTTLWDSAHNQIFDTFIFNSPRDRELLSTKCVNLRPVWDWHEQFTDTEIQFFYNPLYSPPKNPTHPTKSFLPTGAIRLPGLASPLRVSSYVSSNLPPTPQRLVPNTMMHSLQFWTTNYLRWLPPLHLPASGDMQMLLFNMRLVKEIQYLQSTIASFTSHRRRSESSKDSSQDLSEAPPCPHPSSVGAFFPFIGGPREEELLAPPTDTVSTDGLEMDEHQFDTQSILNGPVMK